MVLNTDFVLDISSKIFNEKTITKTELENSLISINLSVKDVFIKMVLITLQGIYILSNGKNTIFDIICPVDGIIYLLKSRLKNVGIKLNINYSHKYEDNDDTFCIINDNSCTKSSDNYQIENFLSYSIFFNNNNNRNNALSGLNNYEAIFLANESYYYMKFEYVDFM